MGLSLAHTIKAIVIFAFGSRLRMETALPNLQRLSSIQHTSVRSTNSIFVLWISNSLNHIFLFLCIEENGLTSNDFKVAALILKMNHLNFGTCLWF